MEKSLKILINCEFFLGKSLRKLSLKDRASQSTNVLSRRLFNLIESKKSNLCVAVDVQTSQELLLFADKVRQI